MGMVTDYLQVCGAYKGRFPKTIVLMQVGSFEEIYATSDGGGCSDLQAVCEALNIQLTRKNKNAGGEASESNPLMAGFPMVALDKYLPVLLDLDYHIVFFDQVTAPPNPRRDVTRILSKGTAVDHVKSARAHNMACIFIETTPAALASRVFVGYAMIDMANGKCAASELLSPPSDPEWALDELYRLLTLHDPIETLLIGKTKSTHATDALLRRLDLRPSSTIVRVNDQYNTLLDSPEYRDRVLRKVYPLGRGEEELVSITHVLGLSDQRCALIAFTALMMLAHSHDETFLRRIEKPRSCEDTGSGLTVCHNSLHQLGVCARSTAGECLLKLLNRCQTGMGQRLFHDRLLSPTSDAAEMERRYDAIEGMRADSRYVQVRASLRGVPDVERLVRRMQLRKLPTGSLPALCGALNTVLNLAEATAAVPDAKAALEGIVDVIDLDAASAGADHVFKAGVHPRLDAVRHDIQVHQADMQRVADAFGGKVEQGRVVTTLKRFTDSKAGISGAKAVTVGPEDVLRRDFTCTKATGSYVRVEHPLLSAACDDCEAKHQELQALCVGTYIAFQDDIVHVHGGRLQVAARALAEVDVISTCALNAFEFRHNRPRARPPLDGAESSRVSVTAMRHPVIEQIQQGREYVVNDLELAGGGVLLFGINSAGKSSLCRALGLNVVLAQAGMFVACEAMDLVPYTQLFSRISSGDDVLRGLSSFTVEMMELRNIIVRADHRSLVLGDEVTAGTEQVSGMAIVSAALAHLERCNASYVFATHLHDIVKVPEVRELQGLRLMHLTCTLDPDTGSIKYGRRLEQGPGDTLYGLEVCRALKMPPTFVRTAQSIRHRLLGVEVDLVSTKKSRYNAKMFVDVCAKCGKRATEVHHRRPQSSADADGFFQAFHKNALHNLESLCDACHLAEHGNSPTST